MFQKTQKVTRESDEIMKCTVETTANKQLQQPHVLDNSSRGQLNVLSFYGRQHNHKKERQQSKVTSPLKVIENLETNREVKSIFETTNTCVTLKTDHKQADSVSEQVISNIPEEGLNLGSNAITTSNVDKQGNASLNSSICVTSEHECDVVIPAELPKSPVNTTQYDGKELLSEFSQCNQPADYLSSDEHQQDPFSVQILATGAAQLNLKAEKNKAVTEATEAVIHDNPPAKKEAYIECLCMLYLFGNMTFKHLLKHGNILHVLFITV